MDNYEIKVLNNQATLNEILSKKASLIRFGDGEFDLIRGNSIPYQKYDPTLAQQIKNLIMKGSTAQLLVGLPDIFEDLNRYNEYCKNFYEQFFFPNNKAILTEIEEQYNVYASTFFSRPYIDVVDKSQASIYFDHLKKLWENRDVLIVEGKYSRSGEGNDLFANAKSIKRIICPARDAYQKKTAIEAEILKYGNGKLILLMLGPAAKIIVSDLYQIIDAQMIDIGHIDSEYEWMKMGAKYKVKIPHKHTAEFNNDDDKVQLESDSAFNQEILSTIE